MYSNFPFSMENIPRQKNFACLSLKFGSILSALIVILYSVLGIALCIETLSENLEGLSSDFWSVVLYVLLVTAIIVHTITLFLTAVMLVGTLREKPQLMRPWVVWTSTQVVVYLALFIYSTTMIVVQHAGGTSILYYALQFLELLLRFYMLMIVASYYKQLEEEQFDGERLKTLVNQDTWYNSA